MRCDQRAGLIEQRVGGGVLRLLETQVGAGEERIGHRNGIAGLLQRRDTGLHERIRAIVAAEGALDPGQGDEQIPRTSGSREHRRLAFTPLDDGGDTETVGRCTLFVAGEQRQQELLQLLASMQFRAGRIRACAICATNAAPRAVTSSNAAAVTMTARDRRLKNRAARYDRLSGCASSASPRRKCWMSRRRASIVR